MATEQNKQNQGTESNVTSIGSAGSKSGAGSAASAKTAPQNSAAAGSQSDNTGTSNEQSTSETGSGVTGTVKTLYNKAKESPVGQTAGEVYGQAKDKAATVLDERKNTVATGLTSVADSLRQVGDNLHTGGVQDNQIANLTAKYSGSLASQVEKLSGYLENKDLREVMRDVETFARRNPAIFLGGAFALGLLAARFLKSSNPNQALVRRSQNDNSLLGNTGNSELRNLSGGSGTAANRNPGGSTGKINTGTKNTDTTNMDTVKRPTV